MTFCVRFLHRFCSSPKVRNNKDKISIFTDLSRNNYATEATFETKPYKLHNLEDGPSTKVSVSQEEATRILRQLLLIRRLETSAGNLYKEKVVRGFCHLSSGQEAIAVGIRSVMRSQDSIISGYRSHGWAYLMGVSPASVLSELTGRKSGCSRGKGGSMHMYSKNFYGGNGIVGAQVPLGTGIAFASKYLGEEGVCFTLYGDGASNQGQVYEAFNMAKLWNIPCIYVCENNGYGMGTSAERSSANTNYYTRGDYIPGIWVDGMDVLAVKEAAQFAINYSLSRGPLVLEMFTYRYSGHSMSDPGTSYRTRDEVQVVRQTRDPITMFKDKLISSGLASDQEIKNLENEVKNMIDEATKKARSDTEIPVEELAADVYSHPLENDIRSILPWDSLKHKTVVKI